MLHPSSSFDSHITKASIGKPDPRFWIALEKVIDEIKDNFSDEISEEQKLYFSQEITNLEGLLEVGGKGNTLRKLQKEALKAIISMLKKGEYEGYIKLPTGVGKTILFALIISAIKEPTLIMVPGKDLINQTKETFEEGFGYEPGEVKALLLENGTASKELENFLENIEGKEWNGVMICTNDSLKSIYRTHPDLLQRLYDRIQVIVTDEAHKALGEVHREMMDEGLSSEINKLHLLFTATPELGQKHLNEHYKPVFEASLQEAVDNKILVLPNHVGPKMAYLNVSDDIGESPTQEFLDAHSLKFLNEDGKPIYESLTDEYLRIKQNAPHGYAPALAVCATINQVDTIVQYLQSKGLRAAKVVSDKDNSLVPNLDAAQAKELINTDQLDVIVTVKKVAEGWDVPTLRNIIRYYPTLSPAQLVQSFGRVIRQVEWKHIEEMVRMMHERGIHTDLSLNEIVTMLLKTRENTNLIEPAQWQMRSVNFEKKDDEEKKEADDKKDEDSDEGEDTGSHTSGNQNNHKILATISHTIQALVDKNELSADEAREFYPDIDIDRSISQMTEAELKEYFKTALAEQGIIDRQSLFNFGPTKFYKEFGVATIGKVLGKTFKGISTKDLQDLADILGFEEINHIETFKTALAGKGIIDRQSLLDFGVMKFYKEFGKITIEKLLGRKIQAVSLQELENLADVLGFKKINRIETFEMSLTDKGIIDRQSLLDFGVIKFYKEFGVTTIGKLLGRKIQAVSVQDLEDLADVFGFEEINHIEAFKVSLADKGIIDRQSLLDFGAKKNQKEFGITTIGKLLEKNISHVTIQDLRDLADVLGFEKINHIETFKIAFADKGILDRQSLLDFGVVNFKKEFGITTIGKLLEKKIKNVSRKDLEDLADALGW